MLAAYCYVATYDGSGLLPPSECRATDIVAWFVCEGAYHLRVSHAIPQNVRIGLATPRRNGSSPTVKWLADRMPTDLAHGSGFEQICKWLDANSHQPAAACWRDILRETRINAGDARFDGPPMPILPAVCGRLRDAVRHMSDFLVVDGEPEYMCIGGNGDRLLLKDEWYSAKSTFVWSRAPISTVLFHVAGVTAGWVRVGLMFDGTPLPERRMSVVLNHNRLWSGTMGAAASGELILACRGECLSDDALNLLQIEVDTAFVPAEQWPSSDYRRLGTALKRFWVQRAEGFA